MASGSFRFPRRVYGSNILQTCVLGKEQKEHMYAYGRQAPKRPLEMCSCTHVRRGLQEESLESDPLRGTYLRAQIERTFLARPACVGRACLLGILARETNTIDEIQFI